MGDELFNQRNALAMRRGGLVAICLAKAFTPSISQSSRSVQGYFIFSISSPVLHNYTSYMGLREWGIRGWRRNHTLLVYIRNDVKTFQSVHTWLALPVLATTNATLRQIVVRRVANSTASSNISRRPLPSHSPSPKRVGKVGDGRIS